MTLARREFFRELLRLQAELIKLQRWVIQKKLLARTNIPEAKWWIIEGNDKKRARLNCIHHLLQQVPYEHVEHPPIMLPERDHNPEYKRRVLPDELYVPEVY